MEIPVLHTEVHLDLRSGWHLSECQEREHAEKLGFYDVFRDLHSLRIPLQAHKPNYDSFYFYFHFGAVFLLA
jgi:hypothetical protein